MTRDKKSGRGNSEWKCGNDTHLDIYKQKASHHSEDSTNDRLATPVLPRPPLPQIDRLQMASTNGFPQGAAEGETWSNAPRTSDLESCESDQV